VITINKGKKGEKEENVEEIKARIYSGYNLMRQDGPILPYCED